jgi:hypothetical protein
MIVSHKHKFVFIKTAKTAGTSIEVGLSKFCGDADIITPLGFPEDEALRQEQGFRGPQNYILPYTTYKIKDWGRLILKKERPQFRTHTSARKARSLLGPDVWKSYFKFCFERNPWDKVISQYHWKRNRGKWESPSSLSEFILSGEASLISRKRGFYLYTINGDIAVDRICLYENMEEELAYIRQRLNLDEPIVVPHAKSAARSDRRHYREVLGEEERLAVAEAFAPEIAHLGYEF